MAKKILFILSTLFFISAQAQQTIDYIASLKSDEGKYVLVSSQVLDEPVASDHRPVLVVLRTEALPHSVR